MLVLFQLVVALAIVAVGHAGVKPETTAESATARMYRDYVGTLYEDIGEAQVNNVYNMVKVFSVSTVEQAQQVVQYVEDHCNLTRSDGRTLRLASNASVEIRDCIYKKEIELLQTFRHTGYNVHNCIRTAQMTYEKSYVELNTKLDKLKAKVVAAYRHHTHLLRNCLDSECNMRTLVQSIVQYEELREELNTEVAEANNLTSRYLVTSIAMGCVSSSLQQIHFNYNVGKDRMVRCFHSDKSNQQHTSQDVRQTTNQSGHDRYGQ